MKISTKTIMRMLRLYDLADDNASVRSFRNLEIFSSGEFVRVSLVLGRNKYVLIFGSMVNEDDIEEFWPDKHSLAELLPSPSDEDETVTPFRGKNLIIYSVPPESERLDVYLAKKFDPSISRSLWQKYIKLGCVQVNGKTDVSVKSEVSETDTIEINFPEIVDTNEQMPIVYEDEDIVVISKPSGILTHAKGGIKQEKTVADFFRMYTNFGLGTDRPGIVHRLDRDTSGLIVGARNEKAAKHLQKQFAERKVEKTYLAIVEGRPDFEQAKVDLPIARHPSKPSTFRVDATGKPAETVYKVLSAGRKRSLVELKPRTGRTHQLRVHMAHLGTPIVGDRVYGKSDERLMLHAYELKITLPSGEVKNLKAPIPEGFLSEFPEVKL